MHCVLCAPNQASPAEQQIRDAKSGDVYASILHASVGDPVSTVESMAQAIPAGPDTLRLVIHCADPSPTDDPARLLAGWSPDGWAKFDESLAELDAWANEHGAELLIRPSAAGMLSDAICTMSWASRSADLGCGLLLDPVGWLTGSMIKDAEDHLTRIAELCLGCDKASALLIRSLRTDEAGNPSQASLGSGSLDATMVVDRLRPLIDSIQTLVVLDPADLELL
tara:strand:+ start:46150 stop:46821 length:672 start_codon:yes stop_codon:yes gene_type:complete